MRPSTNDYFMRMASLVSMRSTCHRRSVGCVLVDENNLVLATGYNGVPRGFPHCNHADQKGLMPHLCDGAFSKSGTNLDSCKAVHAEANALISCRNPEDIRTAYVTASPCETCVRMLLNTKCETIVFEQLYPHRMAEEYWRQSGRKWVHWSPEGEKPSAAKV